MDQIKIKKLVSLPVSKTVAESAVWGLQGVEAILIVRMQPKTLEGQGKTQWLIYHRHELESESEVPDWMEPLIAKGELVGADRNITRLFPEKQFEALQELKLALEIAAEG